MRAIEQSSLSRRIVQEFVLSMFEDPYAKLLQKLTNWIGPILDCRRFKSAFCQQAIGSGFKLAFQFSHEILPLHARRNGR